MASTLHTNAQDTLGFSEYHTPVLFTQLLEFADLTDNYRIVDGTLGLGGHTAGLLEKALKGGYSNVQVLGLDRDRQALHLAKTQLQSYGDAVCTAHACFSDVAREVATLGWEQIDFALVDIGVSSLQIDTDDRGFSFLRDGPLDMRMDPTSGQDAANFVNKASVTKLREVISTLGEDPMAGKIARAIDDARNSKEIRTTLELASIIEKAYPTKMRATARNHPATRTFQAIRMHVNDELGELERFLHDIVPLLNVGGKVAVITFHSLEDRLVKHFFRNETLSCICPSHIPVCICDKKQRLQVLTKKPFCASAEEIARNSRATSAKLRVAQRV